MKRELERLGEQARRLGVPLSSSQVELFERYLRALLETPHNVTALRKAEDVVDRLFLDALAGAPVLAATAGGVVDVGTGGGIPGVPLAIVAPDRRFVLMDASGKKVGFVQGVAAELGLVNVETCMMRAEEAGRAPAMREQFGAAVAKAVAPLRILVEWLIPLVEAEGRVICWKGPAVGQELEEVAGALRMLNAQVERVVTYRVPGSEERSLVVIRRVGPVDPRYPRRVGVAEKRPL